MDFRFERDVRLRHVAALFRDARIISVGDEELRGEQLVRGFGNRLRKVREARNLSRRELAERVGIEFAQISRYERGQALPNVETLIALSDALEVDVNILLRGESADARQRDPIELDLPLLERFRDLRNSPSAIATPSFSSSTPFSRAAMSSSDSKDGRERLQRLRSWCLGGRFVR